MTMNIIYINLNSQAAFVNDAIVSYPVIFMISQPL